MSTWQPFAGGIIPSAWGDEVSVTMDDKLHMTETSNTQTVQGPMVFSNTSVTTFAGPFNNTNTNTNVLSGPVTVGGDLLAKWNADNAVVTRRIAYDFHHIMNAVNRDNPGIHDWHYTYNGEDNNHASITTASQCYLGVFLPDGATITAFRIVGKRDSAGSFSVSLMRNKQSDGTQDVLGYITITTTSFAETNDTVIDDALVDNNAYSYHIFIGNDNNTFRIRCIQIDYTVVRPQP